LVNASRCSVSVVLLQVLFRGSPHFEVKHGARDGHVDLVERVEKRLDVQIVHVVEKVADPIVIADLVQQDKLDVACSEECGQEGIVKLVDDLHVHGVTGPLHLFDNVEARMHNELVHMSRVGSKPRDAIAALFGGAEFCLVQRIVLGPDDGEVVRHMGVCLVENRHITEGDKKESRFKRGYSV